jgi:outer membrane protein OmpA-like peptidoglycan-associated protein
MKLLNLIIILVFILNLSAVSFAQNMDDNKNQTEKTDKIKTAWSAGISGGATILSSDVKYRFKGYGLNININKALSHSLALRIRGGFGTVYGLNDLPAVAYMVTKNTALNGKVDPLVNYIPVPLSGVYTNFKTTYKEAYIEAVYYLPIADFRKNEKQKARIYLFAGGGGFVYNTKVDQLDANGSKYDYTSIAALKQADRTNALKKLLDGNYETQAEIDYNHNTEFLGGSFLASLDGGLGINVSLTSRIDAFVEAAYTYTGSDLVDGVRWQIDGSLTGNDDALILMALGINYRFGKAENVYWFDNPEAMHYKVTLQNKRKIDQVTTDTDGDGVSDYFDKDPETPSGVSVDGSGKPVDTDRDGIPDFIDKEPFSDKSAVVDSVGTALDSDNDGVPDHRDLEPKTPAGTLVNFQGKSIKIPEVERTQQTGTVTPLGFIPVVFFEFNQAYVKPDYFNAAIEIAQALKYYPNDKLKIIGHTDAVGNPEYNIDLGKRRAQSVADLIIAQGIDKSRLIIESKGSVQPLSVVSRKDLDRLNRRVQFEVITGGVMQDKGNKKEDAKNIKKTPPKDKTNNSDIDNLFKKE